MAAVDGAGTKWLACAAKKKSGKALSSFVSSEPTLFARLGMLAHLSFTIISQTIS